MLYIILFYIVNVTAIIISILFNIIYTHNNQANYINLGLPLLHNTTVHGKMYTHQNVMRKCTETP